MNKFVELLKGVLFISRSELKKIARYNNTQLGEKRVEEIAKEIDVNGLFVIEDFYSREQCEKAIDAIDQCMLKYKDKVWVDDEQADFRLFGVDRVSENIALFFNDNFITKVRDYYLKTSASVAGFTLAGRIKATPKNLGSGGGWHRDIIYGKQFKAILYLTDTDYNNGPFEYLEKTHQHSVVIENILNNNIAAGQSRLTEQNIEDILKSGKFTRRVGVGKAGTLILVDTSGIHRGMPIQEGMRYALTNYYFEESIPDIFDLAKK